MTILREQLKGELTAIFAAKDATENDNVFGMVLRDQVGAQVTDGGTAGTAQAEIPIATVTDGGRVTAVRLTTAIAVTASDTNYASFFVQKRTAGGAAVTIGTGTTQTSGSGGLGSLVAWTPVTIVLTDANRVLAAGDILTVSVSKTGSGVAIASATVSANLSVVFERGV